MISFKHTHIMCEVKEGFASILTRNFLINRRNNTMAGTKAGGQKAAAKNLLKDPFFYAKIGAKGGRNGYTGGFAANRELAKIAGAKGGKISRRRKAAKTEETK